MCGSSWVYVWNLYDCYCSASTLPGRRNLAEILPALTRQRLPAWREWANHPHAKTSPEHQSLLSKLLVKELALSAEESGLTTGDPTRSKFLAKIPGECRFPLAVVDRAFWLRQEDSGLPSAAVRLSQSAGENDYEKKPFSMRVIGQNCVKLTHYVFIKRYPKAEIKRQLSPSAGWPFSQNYCSMRLSSVCGERSS